MPPIRFDVAFEEAHPDALAIYCSDGRYTHAVTSLFAHLGRKRLDTLTIPGGPALLDTWSASFGEAETTRSAASFLIEAHKVRYVGLIAHQSCGYYRKRFPHDSPTENRERQAKDLKHAATWLTNRHKGLLVEAFYATAEGKIVEFSRVPVQ